MLENEIFVLLSIDNFVYNNLLMFYTSLTLNEKITNELNLYV